MSRLGSQDGLTPSILDRLIDPDTEGTLWRRGYSIEQMMETVRRDIEDLLNSHRPGPAIRDEFAETRRSVFAYGLPDLVSLYGLGGKLRGVVIQTIEETIRLFEPRLRDVRVSLLHPDDSTQRLKLEIQITAKLCVEPSPEVSFVTVLELTTGQASVQPGGG
jgi:type VI secretion system protein ImpF